ncbi:MAG TPA: helix-turn-helix domain-containing protein [Longimicrobiales bacterium]|nr:helix-turn-helix domain-containing protein [Longimicrobiales bacterium]
MSDKRIEERTDAEIMGELGRRLAQVRKSAALTQADAAERAGLDRSTVSRAEQGDNPNLLTVIRLLRVYGRLGALEAFIPEPGVSPMQLVREARKRG